MDEPARGNPSSMRDKVSAVLREASPALQHLRDDFFIVGASALILAGLEVEYTPDVDILLSTRDAEYLQSEWKNKRLHDFIPPGHDLFRSAFSRYRFSEMDVELMGDLEVYTQGAWHPVIVQDHIAVSIDSMSFKVPTISEQIRILKLFGREKDLKKVTFLEQHRSG